MSKTVGCCSHITAIVYYLAHATYLFKIMKPTEIYSRMVQQDSMLPVIEKAHNNQALTIIKHPGSWEARWLTIIKHPITRGLKLYSHKHYFSDIIFWESHSYINGNLWWKSRPNPSAGSRYMLFLQCLLLLKHLLKSCSFYGPPPPPPPPPPTTTTSGPCQRILWSFSGLALLWLRKVKKHLSLRKYDTTIKFE